MPSGSQVQLLGVTLAPTLVYDITHRALAQLHNLTLTTTTTNPLIYRFRIRT